MTQQDLTQEFYSKPLYLSYSGLNKLLYSPNLFYKYYILQQREEKLDSYLVDGKVIHCLLLDDGSFDKDYIIIPKTLPTENTRIVIDKVFSLYQFKVQSSEEEIVSEDLVGQSDLIVKVLKEINLHQSLKTDEQRIDKIVTEEAKSYWEFLKVKENKTLIDRETLDRCNQSVSALRSNSKVCDLLGLLVSEMDNVTIYNEHYLTIETDYPFGLKGIIDNIKIDHDKKIIHINDLKTTGKTITDFKETIEFYNYWAQAAIYERLAASKFSDILDTGWSIVFNFIVIDKYLQVYAFQVSPGTMMEWQLKLEQKLKEAAWHYKEKNYSLPYQFAKGKVIL